MALYDATNGDDWDDNTNWLIYESICDWYRVYCNSGGHVYGIDLYYNSLQGTIPTELGLLTSLQWLSVCDNFLTGAVPNEVCALRDINGGSLEDLYADCVEEVECTCCNGCCVDGGGCNEVVG